MHDNTTMAFEIRLPFSKSVIRPYGRPLITIWHKDPENFTFKSGERKEGMRSDDSCGWHTPPYTIDQYNEMAKLAKSQYQDIFARQVAEEEGHDYAYVCNAPETTYEVIYWIWRAIKAYGKKGWMYGNKTNFLTSGELEYIMQLASNPVDNFKNRKIENEDSFVEMFISIWRIFRGYHRPWYKHPRWHIHHWSIQFHPWQEFHSKNLRKCVRCKRRGSKSWYGHWGSKYNECWCQDCHEDETQMRRAEKEGQI